MKHSPALLLLLITTLGCRHPSAAEPRPTAVGSTFSFVQITDTHLREAEHWRRTGQVIRRINTLPFKVDFVVHTGDIFMDNITAPGVATRARQLFAGLKVPIYFLAGNHDILAGDREQTRHLMEQHFGPPARAFLHKGVWVVTLYTESLAGRVALPGHDPIVALSKVLVKRATEPVLLFHHAPSTPDFYEGRFHRPWSKTNRTRWNSALKKHGVVALFGGHFHRDELQRVAGIPLFAAPSVAGYWGRQATFRVYTYEDGHITYRNFYVN